MLIKTTQEIEILAKGGKLLGQILQELVKMAVPGVSLASLDAYARKRMEEVGGTPAFLGYKGHKRAPAYPSAVCTSLNAEVVHGIPGDRIIKEGDVVKLDIGMQWPKEKGLFTDTAYTKYIGNPNAEIKRLLEGTQQALGAGIAKAQVGAKLSEISIEIEKVLKKYKLGIVTALVGHGVGHKVHEPPMIPNYTFKGYQDMVLQEGMCIAIEPMATLGEGEVTLGEDGFAYVTQDKSLAAHFEHTIALTKDGPKLITSV